MNRPITLRPWFAHAGNLSADFDQCGRPIDLGRWYIEAEYPNEYLIVGGPFFTRSRCVKEILRQVMTHRGMEASV